MSASSIGGKCTPIVVQNANNLQQEYGLSSFDIRHTARINCTLYELPLGQATVLDKRDWLALYLAIGDSAEISARKRARRIRRK